MVRRPGTDVTVVTYGSLVGTAVGAAEEAQRQRGWSLEVIDLRSLVPGRRTIARPIGGSGREASTTPRPW
ncbi:transketolase C-terminal domain-containing protein [Mycobacterium intracellulare]|uniref:transketolase C-terminal domain-containing protein n=1 Tax=Mycobacterium intracellulare TaxID=1767 RepID=UPI003BF81C25